MNTDRKAAESRRLYGEVRTKCLDQLSGGHDTSVSSQLRGLFFHDGVFRMLNEVRRIEAGRPVSGVAWRLVTAGYVALLATGIRRLVDDDRRADSLMRIISTLRENRHLLTRKHYVEHGGDPYDSENAKDRYFREVIGAGATDGEAVHRGHIGWAWSEQKHSKFDDLTDGDRRDPAQVISLSVFDRLSRALKAPALIRVTTYTDKAIAHAERLTEEIDRPTYDDIDESLKILCQVRNFISTAIFFDSDHSQAVPTPQFNIAEHLDVPFALPETAIALQDFWKSYSGDRTEWSSASSGYDRQFLANAAQ
jgi:AbiU2